MRDVTTFSWVTNTKTLLSLQTVPIALTLVFITTTANAVFIQITRLTHSAEIAMVHVHFSSCYFCFTSFFFLSFMSFAVLCCVKCKWEGDHKGHSTIPLGESSNELKTALEGSVSTIKRYQTALKEMPQRTNRLLDDTSVKTQEAAAVVRKGFAEIREALDKKEVEILKALEEKTMCEEEIRELTSGTQGLVEELPSILESAKTLLSNWDSSTLTAETASRVLSIERKQRAAVRLLRSLRH